MKLDPLSQDLLDDTRALIDATIARWPDTSGRRALIRFGIYPVVWTITSLDQELLGRVTWQLSQIGFTIDEILVFDVQLSESVVKETFFAVNVNRIGLFHPDYLFGEAVAITTVCQQWGCSLDSFGLDTTANRKAGQGIYGPVGKDIA